MPNSRLKGRQEQTERTHQEEKQPAQVELLDHHSQRTSKHRTANLCRGGRDVANAIKTTVSCVMDKKLDLFKACLQPKKSNIKTFRKERPGCRIAPVWQIIKTGGKGSKICRASAATAQPGWRAAAGLASPFLGTDHGARRQSRAR